MDELLFVRGLSLPPIREDARRVRPRLLNKREKTGFSFDAFEFA